MSDPAASTPIRLALDWSAYDAYGAGDAYAQLPRDGEGLGKASAVCIGSRTCQRNDAKSVMCPSFRATGDTRHSTQHRAATLKAALNGELGEQPFARPELHEAMDLCVACKGCKRECPNGVDMALMRTEVLAQRWRLQAMPLREQLFARLPDWLHAVRRWPGLRQLLGARQAGGWIARLLEQRLGIAAGRSLPALAPQSFLQRTPQAVAPAAAAHTPPARREVVLLVDTFSNQFDPSTAQAAVEVLQAAGCTVHLAQPPAGEAPLCCGRTALSGGLVDQARAHAQRLIAALQPHVDAGRLVIGLEPSCLLMLRDEYHSLGLGEPAQRLARQALLLEEFLARECDVTDHPQRLKLPLGAVAQPSALVHGHCHQKAFGTLKAMRKVLGWVPGLQVEFIESSCCGMAGSFGLEAEHHAVSMQMAELSLLPAVRAAQPESWLIANGTSCRHQIRDGAQREARHFVHLLQASCRAGLAAAPEAAAPSAA